MAQLVGERGPRSVLVRDRDPVRVAQLDEEPATPVRVEDRSSTGREHERGVLPLGRLESFLVLSDPVCSEHLNERRLEFEGAPRELVLHLRDHLEPSRRVPPHRRHDVKMVPVERVPPETGGLLPPETDLEHEEPHRTETVAGQSLTEPREHLVGDPVLLRRRTSRERDPRVPSHVPRSLASPDRHVEHE